ncbi:MAG TPA: amidohydrolase family protein [Albidovulum sp.]|uniref:metal-dependent hydrolase family protein n=1 Tax=Albidovulum sp. TaxID=1872424 RepID=UPI002B8FF320|nr:amidohydrolase family protein [Albidovulum sp.]
MLFRSRSAGCNHIVARPNCACCSAEVRQLTARVNHDLSRRGFVAGGSASVALLGLAAYSGPVRAQDASAPITVFKNVKLFNGVDSDLKAGVNVIVQGDKVTDIVTGDLTPSEGATVIDGSGRTLMPGLIDAHWHTMIAALTVQALLTVAEGDIHFAAAQQAERTLMRGFTTVRDMGGPAFALKRAIDSGIVAGPRIYPSGALISQTSGHGDFRNIWELPGYEGKLSRAEVLNAAALADGRAAVLRATREQLMQGASQIKLVAGGGIASVYDPIDVTEFLPEELEAAVLAAADWGTYVSAHVYTATGIQRCLKAGVKSIEHGQLADEDSVKMMADTGAVWSLQPFVKELHANPDALPPERRQKWEAVWQGTDRAYELAVKHKVPVGFGTDFLFDPKGAELQNKWLAAMTRWYTPASAARAATSDNAFILGMSGPRNPYAAGKLGVIEKGAYADMLLVDGDPTTDFGFVADPDTNFRIIMKGGTVYKNTLGA